MQDGMNQGERAFWAYCPNPSDETRTYDIHSANDFPPLPKPWKLIELNCTGTQGDSRNADPGFAPITLPEQLACLVLNDAVRLHPHVYIRIVWFVCSQRSDLREIASALACSILKCEYNS